MPSPILSPGLFRSFLANGSVNASGTVSFFAAGTSTPQATYPTSVDAAAGTNANANPLTLNANGEAQVWVNALAYKIVTKDSGGSTLETIDNWLPAASSAVITPGGGSSSSAISQWVPIVNTSTLLPPTLAFVGTTQFTVNAGADLIATYALAAGDRVKTTNSGGTVTSTVLGVTYSAPNNTIIVVNDGAGVIDAGLSALWIGLLHKAAPSYLDPRAAVRMQKNGNQTGFGSIAQVTTWTSIIDALTEVSGSQITVKYSGFYYVEFEAEVSDTAASQLISATINVGGVSQGNFPMSTSATAGQHTTTRAGMMLTLTAGNVLTFSLTGTANTTVYGGATTCVNYLRQP